MNVIAERDAYIAEHQVPVNPLFELGYGSIGCAPCTRPVAPGEDPRAGRWAGSNKTECGIHTAVTPITVAPALVNSGIASANICASILQPGVNAAGKK